MVLPCGSISLCVTAPIVFLNNKPDDCPLEEWQCMVLSETRGLWLSSIVREGTSLSSAFFRGLQTSTPDTRGFSRSYNQAAQVPSSKVTRISPRSPSMNCKMVLALVSMTLSITTLPTEFLTQIEMLSLCTSIPIYLTLVIKKGAPFWRSLSNALKTYSKGAPFYNMWVLVPR